MSEAGESGAVAIGVVIACDGGGCSANTALRRSF